MSYPPITLTGLDERTDLDEVLALATDGVEFGVLLSAMPEGRNRYPSLDFIELAAVTLGRKLAVHLCGANARDKFVSGEYDEVLRKVGRVQINGNIDMTTLLMATGRFPLQEIITQYVHGKERLVGVSMLGNRHSLLVDGSGGNGKLPAEWLPPATHKRVGFAGGLNAGNLAKEVPRIAAVARTGWWIDMEAGVRNADDWFDLAKADACIRAAHSAIITP